MDPKIVKLSEAGCVLRNSITEIRNSITEIRNSTTEIGISPTTEIGISDLLKRRPELADRWVVVIYAFFLNPDGGIGNCEDERACVCGPVGSCYHHRYHHYPPKFAETDFLFESRELAERALAKAVLLGVI